MILPGERIKLTKAQSQIFQSEARYRVAVCGRRFGKTVVGITYLLQKVCDPKARDLKVWLIANTYRQAAQVAWGDLKKMVPTGWTKKINESDLAIELYNGCTIALRGADNPDSLRGVGLDAVVFDQFQDMDPMVWLAVISPALSDRRGSALFLGTPKGFNHLYDMWNAAHAQPGWQAWQFTTEEGGQVHPEELAMQRRNLDERTYKQEFLASFECMSGLVYQNFDRAVNVRDDLVDTGAELRVGMDFNHSPLTCTIGVMAGDQLHVLDEIEINNAHTQMMADELKRRYPKRRIIVYPDPSGCARKTSAGGQTDFSILRAAGFHVIAPSKAPLVVDRVNCVNAALKNAAGESKVFIHPRCKSLLKGFEGQTYKEGTNIPEKSLGLDHILDAVGYKISEIFPLIKRTLTISAFPF